MELTTFESDDTTVHAGYICPCGCTPSVTHRRGGESATNECCCGNEFAVGPHAERSLVSREGFELKTEQRVAAWGEPVMAAWLVGPSVHPEPLGDGDEDHGHHHDETNDDSTVVDPVCGMGVVAAVALEKGLHRPHEGVDYYFCGKGCYLEFGDGPERLLDPQYVPSM